MRTATERTIGQTPQDETPAFSVDTGTAITGQPACPQCGGRMWDNRASKRNPKAPDFKCRDRRCDGVLWPGQHHVAEPIITPRKDPLSVVPASTDADGNTPESPTPSVELSGLRRCYLDVTDFVLRDVRTKYQGAGLPCTDATIAAIVATLFIAACREHGV